MTAFLNNLPKSSFALFIALALGLYGCGGSPEQAAPSESTEDHDHEHADGEEHDHEHADEGDAEHAEGDDHDHEHADGEEHGHHHAAPHGGTLVALGDHFAHLEILLDPETGKMTVYVLDGEAENPVRLVQEEIEFSVALKREGEGTSVTMLQARAVENPLTGETVGDSSEFTVESDKLIGVAAFSAVVSTLEIKGEKIDDVEFDFPEGNE